MVTHSASPIYICPVVAHHDEQFEIVVPGEENMDPKMALMGEPIDGMENMTLEKGRSPGAILTKWTVFE